ncbi:MAG: WecB/TagA/CpsF family glycosyltransferase [Candidatus Paceibacterota bacterium]
MSESVLNQSESTSRLWPDKVDLFGVQVSCVDYDAALSCIIQAAKSGHAGIVACHAVHAIVTASNDAALRTHVNRFSMITPDGQPVRWALNWLHGTGLTDRVYGPELMLRVCRAAAAEGISIYLYGGSPRVLQMLEKNLRAKVPPLEIAGSEAPPFRPLTDKENEAVCRRINQSGARILMIGLGCPKQDLFAGHNRNRIAAVQLCTGAAFDFHAGVKPTAPLWMQENGLEWIFRLWCEPKRLWRRYLVTNTVFVAKLALAISKHTIRLDRTDRRADDPIHESL